MMDITQLAKVIIEMVISYHGFCRSNFSNQSLLLTFKFISLLCYILSVKQNLSTIFHAQTDIQAKKQNTIKEAALYVFVNRKEKDWAKLLSITESRYNNPKNPSTGHTLFELKYILYRYMFFQDEVDTCSRSFFANKPVKKLRK